MPFSAPYFLKGCGRSMKVTAIMAHPDDTDLWCGGTLRKYYEQGHEISVVVVTNGRTGTNEAVSDSWLIETRQQEQLSSAKIYGAKEVLFLGNDDSELFETPETRKQIITAIRKLAPDVILTHNLKDQNSDHRVTAQLVTNSLIPLPLYTVRADAPAVETVPVVFMADTYAGIDNQPEVYVDITQQYPFKEKALGCHKTQLTGEIKWMELMALQSRFRGFQAGCGYAEGFTGFRVYSSIPDYHLLP